MKQWLQSLALSVLCLAAAACRPQGQDGTVTVPDNISSKSLLPLIRSVEVILLETREDDLLGSVSLYAASDGYIAVDARNLKIHHYARDGRFLNAVGHGGRGPQEYPMVTDVQVQDGQVNVFSLGAGKETFFGEDGSFLGRRDLSDLTHCWKVPEGLLAYQGYAYRGKSLVSLVREDGSEEELLPKPADGLISMLDARVFSSRGADTFIVPEWSQAVYRYRGGAVEPWLELDFGKYGLGTDFYQSEDMMSAFMSRMQTGMAFVSRYFERDRMRLVHCILNRVDLSTGEGETINNYGLFRDGRWTWFRLFDEDPVHASVQYLEDDALVYCLSPLDLEHLDPALREKISNPAALDGLSEDDNSVVLKLHLK